MLWEGQCRVFPIEQNTLCVTERIPLSAKPTNTSTHWNAIHHKDISLCHFTGSNAVIKTINIPLTVVPIFPTGDFDHQFAHHPNRSTVVTKRFYITGLYSSIFIQDTSCWLTNSKKDIQTVHHNYMYVSLLFAKMFRLFKHFNLQGISKRMVRI